MSNWPTNAKQFGSYIPSEYICLCAEKLKQWLKEIQ